MVYDRMFQYSYVPGILGLWEPYSLRGLNDHRQEPWDIISSPSELLHKFPANGIRIQPFPHFGPISTSMCYAGKDMSTWHEHICICLSAAVCSANVQNILCLVEVAALGATEAVYATKRSPPSHLCGIAFVFFLTSVGALGNLEACLGVFSCLVTWICMICKSKFKHFPQWQGRSHLNL